MTVPHGTRQPAPPDKRGPAREMGKPECGHWLVILTRGGVPTPARIYIAREAEHEGLPIDPWPNSETRILGIFADIAGEPVDVDEVWLKRGQPITESEYRYRVADHDWAKRYAPHLPEADPRKAVRLADVPVPFGDDQ